LFGAIGLAHYAETFRADDIDGELLGRLTSDDLNEIGVASFGHRKKLLEAIAEFRNAPAAAPAVTPVMPAPIPAANGIGYPSRSCRPSPASVTACTNA
jgi:SAM domain (Sterile alpha motif)